MSIKAKNVIIGSGSKNYGTIIASQSVTVAAGGSTTATSNITAPTVTIAQGATNAGTITGDVTLYGVNTGAVTGAMVIKSTGNNSGAVSGTVTNTEGGTNNNSGYKSWSIATTSGYATVYTSSTVTDLNDATVFSTTELDVAYNSKFFTYGDTNVTYATNEFGLCKSYVEYSVTEDTNGGKLYSVVNYSNTNVSQYIYVNALLTSEYTGYYFYDSRGWYVDAGVQKTYRPWDTSAGTRYTLVTANSLESAVVYTSSNLAENAKVLDATFYTGTEFASGYARVITNNVGVASVTQALEHAYDTNNNGYHAYYDAATISSADVLYTDHYTFSTLNNATFYVGNENNAGYTEITTNGSGVATVTLSDGRYNVSLNGIFYYFEKATPETNDRIFTGDYTFSTHGQGTLFWVGTENDSSYKRVRILGTDGKATVTAVNHPEYNASGDFYYDTTIATGEYAYTGRYTDAPKTGVGYSDGTEGSAGYQNISTDSGNGLITVSQASEHTTVVYVTGSTTEYYADSALATDVVLYTMHFSFSKAINKDFYVGTSGEESYKHVTTDGNGVATVTPVYHTYQTGSYYHDNSTIATGDYIYTGRRSMDLAISASVTAAITTDSDGKAVVATAISYNVNIVSGATIGATTIYSSSDTTIDAGPLFTNIGLTTYLSIGISFTYSGGYYTTSPNGNGTVGNNSWSVYNLSGGGTTTIYTHPGVDLSGGAPVYSDQGNTPYNGSFIYNDKAYTSENGSVRSDYASLPIMFTGTYQNAYVPAGTTVVGVDINFYNSQFLNSPYTTYEITFNGKVYKDVGAVYHYSVVTGIHQAPYINDNKYSNYGDSGTDSPTVVTGAARFTNNDYYNFGESGITSSPSLADGPIGNRLYHAGSDLGVCTTASNLLPDCDGGQSLTIIYAGLNAFDYIWLVEAAGGQFNTWYLNGILFGRFVLNGTKYFLDGAGRIYDTYTCTEYTD